MELVQLLSLRPPRLQRVVRIRRDVSPLHPLRPAIIGVGGHGRKFDGQTQRQDAGAARNGIRPAGGPRQHGHSKRPELTRPAVDTALKARRQYGPWAFLELPKKTSSSASTAARHPCSSMPGSSIPTNTARSGFQEPSGSRAKTRCRRSSEDRSSQLRGHDDDQPGCDRAESR